uniref:(northern house mosquito) hypothetical protein n=2 Tax=Culex pipiens TaxID=7175 RepID=A0A8D8B028_CULPI
MCRKSPYWKFRNFQNFQNQRKKTCRNYKTPTQITFTLKKGKSLGTLIWFTTASGSIRPFTEPVTPSGSVRIGENTGVLRCFKSLKITRILSHVTSIRMGTSKLRENRSCSPLSRLFRSCSESAGKRIKREKPKGLPCRA